MSHHLVKVNHIPLMSGSEPPPRPHNQFCEERGQTLEVLRVRALAGMY